jgi:hypothetical protein
LLAHRDFDVSCDVRDAADLADASHCTGPFYAFAVHGEQEFLARVPNAE